jgi:hypothetical protein
MFDAETYAIKDIARCSRTRYPSDLCKQALLIRSAKDSEQRAFILRTILDERAEYLKWLTIGQRDWQSKVGRTPQKGRHHDSWAMREGYVRCKGSYGDYLEYAHEQQLAHGWTKKTGGFPCKSA